MYRSVLLPVAKEDIKDAASWYESKKAKLGKRFALHVRQIIATIKENPYLYAIRYNEVRTAVLDVFPFMIHYVIDDLGKKIVIIAVYIPVEIQIYGGQSETKKEVRLLQPLHHLPSLLIHQNAIF